MPQKDLPPLDLHRVSVARQLTVRSAGRRRRVALRLQVTELARAIGVHPNTVLRWEEGTSVPSTAHAVAWLDALEVAEAHRTPSQKRDVA